MMAIQMTKGHWKKNERLGDSAAENKKYKECEIELMTSWRKKVLKSQLSLEGSMRHPWLELNHFDTTLYYSGDLLDLETRELD